jgi:hypothetical protein
VGATELVPFSPCLEEPGDLLKDDARPGTERAAEREKIVSRHAPGCLNSRQRDLGQAEAESTGTADERSTPITSASQACADRILEGAQPADLPIERPTACELIVNAKTAKGLRVSVPPSLLARAGRVIQ